MVSRMAITSVGEILIPPDLNLFGGKSNKSLEPRAEGKKGYNKIELKGRKGINIITR